jgi:poly-gamma-glutamate synthesis protein (capsule biosynthesis protein)
MNSVRPASTAAAAGVSVSLSAVGDLYLGRPLRGETGASFAAALREFRKAQLRFANLECVLLSEPPAAAAAAAGAWAAASAELGEELRWLGVDVVSTANNHAGDYGVDGIRQTGRVLRDMGIAFAGTGADAIGARAPALVRAGNATVAVLAASASHMPHARAGHAACGLPGRPGLAPLRFGTTYHVDDQAFDSLRRILAKIPLAGPDHHRERALERRYDREQGETLSFFGREFVRSDSFAVRSWAAPDDVAEIEDSIRSAREAADFVVFSMHSHEYDARPDAPTAFFVECARRAIDAGAHVVIGHGVHGVRGIELYRGHPIFYGLGAFVFQPYLSPWQPDDFFAAYGMRGATLQETYQVRKGAAGFFDRPQAWRSLLVQLELRSGEAPGFTVRPATGWEAGCESPDGIPHLAAGAPALELLHEVRRLSKGFGTSLRLDEENEVLAYP